MIQTYPLKLFQKDSFCTIDICLQMTMYIIMQIANGEPIWGQENLFLGF